MGKLNVIKAGYEGKVGTTYGVAKKSRFYVKAVPFSHTPHNNLQTAAKDKFTGLNRIASRVVKKMWQYLGLSDKAMYRNNALCSAWKNALEGSTFSLNNLSLVISQVGALEIKEVEYNPQRYSFAYSANEQVPTSLSKRQVIYLAVVTNRFVTKADVSGVGDSLLLKSAFDYIDFAYFQVWAFKAVPNGKKWQIKGLSITEPVYIIIVNKVFYISRWHWVSSPYVRNSTLYLPSESVHIQNGVMVLR